MAITKEIIQSMKQRPIWTVYSLLLAPFFYTFVFLAAITIGLISLSNEDAIAFWSENT